MGDKTADPILLGILILPLLLVSCSEGIDVQVMERLCNQTVQPALCMESMKSQPQQPVTASDPQGFPWPWMAPPADDEAQAAQLLVGCATSELTELSKATDRYVALMAVLEEECQPRLAAAEEAVRGLVVPMIRRGQWEEAENVIDTRVLRSLWECRHELEARGMSVPTYLDNRTFRASFRWKLALEILRTFNS